MNNWLVEEFTNNLERIFSSACEYKYSLPAIEHNIAYSSYFQTIEKDHGFPLMGNETELVKEILPELDIDLSKVPVYNQCLWAAESYIRIQERTLFTYELIFLYIPISKMFECFTLYHEMDFEHIIKEFERLYSQKSVLSVLLDKNGWSLKSVSKTTGISYDTLYSLKQRRRDPKKLSIESALKLTNIFRVRVETLAEIGK